MSVIEQCCVGCKANFVPSRKGIEYCTRWCVRVKPKSIECCQYCGLTFEVRNYRKGVAKFCSRRCSTSSRRGEKAPNWKGGISNNRQTEMSRHEYKEWRKAVFMRDGFQCVFCGESGYLQADHIKPWSQFPELRLEVDNGRTLCPPCHRKTPTYGGGSIIKKEVICA